MTGEANHVVETAGDGPRGRVDEAVLADRLVGSTAPVSLADVTKRYGSVLALDDVTFEVAPGELHCLAGPNGSGKTTLGKLAAGLTAPTSGTVNVPRDELGFGFQRPRFYPDLSVRENLDVFCRTLGTSLDDEWVETLRSALRLTRVEQQPAAELSGGFEKKLDLAIALLGAPTYVWLDEPLSNVDDLSVTRIVSLLESYVACGGGVVASTHDLERFADATTHLTAFLDGSVSPTVALDEPDGPSLQRRYRTLADGLRRGPSSG